MKFVIENWELISGILMFAYTLYTKIFGNNKWLNSVADKARKYLDEHDIKVIDIIEQVASVENKTNDEKRAYAAEILISIAKNNGLTINKQVAELIIDSAYRAYKGCIK